MIPGFKGKNSLGHESNQVWPVSLLEKTDVLITNKILNQLRDLLHSKLIEEKSKINKIYIQMKKDKQWVSHNELSSGDKSHKGERNNSDFAIKLAGWLRAARVVIKATPLPEIGLE
jgi:hypothetical protein